MEYENRESEVNFEAQPIPEASAEIREKFANAEWRSIPIAETLTENPKKLEVISNSPMPSRAMGWPAYYKKVKEGASDDMSGFGELAQAIKGTIQKSPLVKARSEVKSRLDNAQRMLDSNPKTADLQLVLVDGYRQLDVQKGLFDAYYNYLAKEHSDLSESELKDKARKMVSEPVTDPDRLQKSPPPHSTGGSADVVLVYKNKIDITSDHWLNDAMVPFGAKFDEMMDPVYKDERSETVFYERKLQTHGELSAADQQALKFRRILHHTMTSAGFTNYHTEFWHYDFGNQFEAAVSGKQQAEYGFAGGVVDGQIQENLIDEQLAFARYVTQQGLNQIQADEVKHHFGI